MKKKLIFAIVIACAVIATALLLFVTSAQNSRNQPLADEQVRQFMEDFAEQDEPLELDVPRTVTARDGEEFTITLTEG